KAAGLSEQADQFLLLCDLRVTLHKKRNIDLFRDHLLQQFVSLGVFIEIVGSEHHHTNAGSLSPPETFHCRFDRLAPDLTACDFDNGTKIAGEGTAAGSIDAEQRSD